MAILLEIITALSALLPSLPEVASLVQIAMQIVQSGVVTPEQEASVRAQLNAVKAAIDAA